MPTRYSGTPEERQALSTYIRLWRASHAVEVAANRHLADHGLTISQFGVLEAVYHVGPLTMVIDNLERDGLVTRERDPQDRRVMRVTLTAQGEALISELLPDHVRGICTLFGVMEPAELETLGDLLRKLGLGVVGLTQGAPAKPATS